MWVQQQYIGLGDAGTIATVGAMRRMIRQYAGAPIVRRMASAIVQDIDGRDSSRQIGAIRAWLATHFRFVRDPRHIELLHTPEFLLRDFATRGFMQGDCDDVAVLGGALGMSIGLAARLVTVGFEPRGPYAHVWVDLRGPGMVAWSELDTTRSRPDLVHMIQRFAAHDV